MKKFFIFLILATFYTPSIFAANYEFYVPFSASHENFSYTTNPQIFASSAPENAKINGVGRFISKDFYCIAPEVDGDSMNGILMASNPFVSLIPSNLNTIENTKPNFIAMQFFPKTFLGNQEKNIVQVRSFGKKENSGNVTINCQIKNEIFEANWFTYNTKRFFEQIKTSDTLILHIQPEIGTIIKARYASPFASENIVKVTSNLSTDPNIKHLELMPEFLCYKKYGCEVSKAIITKLNGDKIDITNKIYILSNGTISNDYSIVDGGISIPKDTKDITFTYKKI